MSAPARNLVILANAGTGKTFALATRFIRLMMLDGAEPEKIVALTFARTAAHEIFQKLLARLWAAARSEEAASAERDRLLEGYDAASAGKILAERSFASADFLRLLKKTLSVQHLGTVSTIDSFILRLVGAFPFEMGFLGGVEVLDGFGESEEIRLALKNVLSMKDAPRDMTACYRRALDGKAKRMPSAAVSGMVEKWRETGLADPGVFDLSAAEMLERIGVENPPPADLSGILNGRKASSVEAKMAKTLEDWKPGKPLFPATIGGVALRRFLSRPDETSFSFELKGKEYAADLEAAEAELVLAALKRNIRSELLGKAESMVACLAFVRMFEEAYSKSARRRGRLSFSDIAEAGSAGCIPIENVEYRFDARFDHWALDEFQDTSTMQWMCLSNLVRSAAQDRSAIVVGDLKQSIYTWRGGNDAPFLEIMEWPEFSDGVEGRIERLALSRRYGANIAGFVNNLFGRGNVESSVPAERSKAVGKWFAGNCWMEHETPEGADADHVKVVFVEPREEDDGEEETYPPAVEAMALALEKAWRRHEEAGSEEKVAVLVRNNDTGRIVTRCLRDHSLPAVWEGETSVNDCPATAALLELLKLSVHPEDAFAWRTVETLYPVRRAVFPDAASPDEVSKLVADDILKSGLARTVREYASRLASVRTVRDGMSESYLSALIRAAARYEETSQFPDDVDGFRRFVESAKGRESASSTRAIRVLTIHRSKGLTFDRTFVPIVESSRRADMCEPHSGTILRSPGDGPARWVFPLCPAARCGASPALSAAYSAVCDDNLLSSLRTYYVAMTRSVKELCVFVQPFPGEGTYFSGMLRGACGGEGVFEAGSEPAYAPGPALRRRAKTPGWHFEKAGSVRAKPATPSRTPRRVRLATAAAEAGVGFHDALAAIEWADGAELAALPASFREAFSKPSPDARVWRERQYEILRSGRWESGRFDRIVFTPGAAGMRAAIYDFKTDRPRGGETLDSFHGRMRSEYAAQIESYAFALRSMTGIPQGSIVCKLLFSSTDTSIEI